MTLCNVRDRGLACSNEPTNNYHSATTVSLRCNKCFSTFQLICVYFSVVVQVSDGCFPCESSEEPSVSWVLQSNKEQQS